VGAGPFVVVSDKLSSKLVVKRNPLFFKKGQPYLDGITFQSIASEQAAYQAMLAGQGDVTGLGTPPLIKQAQQNSKFTVTIQPGTSPYVIQLNTMTAPFNNLKAREAIYYATDWKAIDKGIFGNQYPITESFTAPAGLFYHQNVPGYRTYDLAKAKALVKQLGGLKVMLGTLSGFIPDEIDKALQTQWKKAGIETKIESWQLNTLVEEFNGKKWQAMLQTAGAWDPAAGIGVAFRFSSTSPFTGVKDPKLDKILTQAASILDPAKRDQLYQQAAKYISDHAYAPFGLAIAGASVVAKGIHGPGLTTKEPSIAVAAQTIWSEVYQDKG
jgi:peptide/nickel transport system substrate-binding protein